MSSCKLEQKFSGGKQADQGLTVAKGCSVSVPMIEIHLCTWNVFSEGKDLKVVCSAW